MKQFRDKFHSTPGSNSRYSNWDNNAETDMLKATLQAAETDPNEEVFKGAQSATIGHVGSRVHYSRARFTYQGRWVERYLRGMIGRKWSEIEADVKLRVPEHLYKSVMEGGLKNYVSRTVKEGLYASDYRYDMTEPYDYNINLDGVLEYRPYKCSRHIYPTFPCGTSTDFFIDVKHRVLKNAHGGYMMHEYHNVNMKWSLKDDLFMEVLDRPWKPYRGKHALKNVKWRSTSDYDRWSCTKRAMSNKEIKEFLNKYKEKFTDVKT